jgi:hypothetical protein
MEDFKTLSGESFELAEVDHVDWDRPLPVVGSHGAVAEAQINTTPVRDRIFLKGNSGKVIELWASDRETIGAELRKRGF